MPLQPIVPTWLAINACNDASASGFTDLRTGQPINAGGLNLGDYFDLTEQQANQLSYKTQGLLHWGRYRRVQVDAAATAANLAQGFAGYLVPGYSVQSVAIVTPGSGQTAGTYTATSSTAGGTQVAVIQYTISSSGTLVGLPIVTQPGAGFTSIPTFTIAAGGTPAAVLAQMLPNADIITDFTHADIATTQPRCIMLNSITPGNFGFIQEEGLATLAMGATIGTAARGGNANVLTPGSFTSAAAGGPVATTAGTWIDSPAINGLYRALLVLTPTYVE